MIKNTAQVWDKVWDDPHLVTEYELLLKTEAATIRWKRIKSVLASQFETLKHLQVLEIGSGMGTYAALLAAQGAEATVLDYSPKALERAKDFFKSNRLKVKPVAADALQPPTNFKNKFDISISVGLTEHFKGKKRLQINAFHLEVLKKNGVAIIIVPNKYNPPYRVFKTVSELLGVWKFGEEYPYSRAELLQLPDKLGGTFLALFGDDLYSSIKFLLPANFLRRALRVGTPRSEAEIRDETGTVLDDYLSYSLVLMMKKK